MSRHARIGSYGKMTSKGQTTVPKDVRDALGLVEGSQIEWIIKDGQALVRPRTLRAAELAGFLGPSPVGPVTLEEMDEAIADAAVERFRRSSQ